MNDDEELMGELREIADADVDPPKRAEMQILAIIREYGRGVIAAGGRCPCCGHKPKKHQ